jgi:hypothetical protein
LKGNKYTIGDHCLQDVVVHHSQLATQPLDDSIELEAIPTQPAVSFRDFHSPHQLSKTNLLAVPDPQTSGLRIRKKKFLAYFLL